MTSDARPTSPTPSDPRQPSARSGPDDPGPSTSPPPEEPDAAPATAYDLATLRAGIPILERAVPMNNCSQGPQTTRTRAAAERYLDSWRDDGMDWDRWIDEVEAARTAFARLVNADADEVAVFSSVSHATAAVASALPSLADRSDRRPASATTPVTHAGRRTVALTEAEFPTVAHVWKAREARGTPLRWIPVRDGCVAAEDIRAALDDDVLLLSATHGYYQTGALLDLEAVATAARDAGALLYVDAYQSLGAVPVDVKALGLDMLASGNLKYLLGIPGIAFLYVRRALAERMQPAVTGWFGRADPFAFDPHHGRPLDWAPGARRFDTGTPPILPAYVARAGMETLLDLGMHDVRAWTCVLADRLASGARELGLEVMGPADAWRRTPTTAIRVADAHAVEASMRAHGVIASARGPAIRLAPHAYTSLDDVERTLEALAAATAGTAGTGGVGGTGRE